MKVTCIKTIEQGNACFVDGNEYEAHPVPHNYGRVAITDDNGNIANITPINLKKHFE